LPPLLLLIFISFQHYYEAIRPFLHIGTFSLTVCQLVPFPFLVCLATVLHYKEGSLVSYMSPSKVLAAFITPASYPVIRFPVQSTSQTIANSSGFDREYRYLVTSSVGLLSFNSFTHTSNSYTAALLLTAQSPYLLDTAP